MRKHLIYDKTTGETKVENIPEHLAGLEGEELMRALVHDCPECRAAMARGEQPTFGIGEPPGMRDIIRGRRPRWRNLKRNVRR